MQFKKRYTFNRIDQDLAPDKRDSATHLNIVNMEVFLTSRGASLQAAKGPQEFNNTIGFFAPYNNSAEKVYVIGHGYIDDDMYIFVTDNRGTPNATSKDTIYRITSTSELLEMKYIKHGNWGFSTQNPITCWGITEHARSEKLYWVDGYNQMRFTNVLDDDTNVDYVLSNPTPAMISAISYGLAASKDAVVRYGYTQYNIGGSESKLSMLTSPINIYTEGDSAQVSITGLTSIYEAYRVYRVMWESYNDAPTFDIIAEGLVDSSNPSVTIIDGGNLFISSVSTEEFFDIGSDLVIPKAIIPKKQRLFLGNYKVEPFRVDNDLRAFQFGGGTTSWDTPSAIPADLNLQYAPVTGYGEPVRATMYEYIDGNIVSGTLEPLVDYVDFTVPFDKFYVQGDASSSDVILEIYEFNDTTFSGPVVTKKISGGIDHDVRPIYKISLGGNYSSGYRIRMTAFSKDVVPVPCAIAWDEELWQVYQFDIQHTTVPTIGGWLYSGVTGVLDTSRVKFSFLPPSQTSNLSDWIGDNGGPTPGVEGSTEVVATVVGSHTEFTITRIGQLEIGGNIIHDYTNPYVYIEADLTGTRQQLLSTGGSIRLTDAANKNIAEGSRTVDNTYDSWVDVPTDHDSVNWDPFTYIYQSNGSTLGAEGRYLKLEWTSVTGGTVDHKERVFKQGETYRIGVVCQDKYGRMSDAIWVADLRVPYSSSGNATTGERNFYRLVGTIKEFPTNSGIVAMKFVYVKREIWDSTVIGQGIVQPVMEYNLDATPVGLYPFPTTKELKGNGTTTTYGWFDVRVGSNPNSETDFPLNGTTRSTTDLHDHKINLVYSPETALFKTDLPINRLRLVGSQEIVTSKTHIEFYNPSAGYEGQKTINNSIVFDIRNNLDGTPSVAPVCLLDDFTDHDNEKDAYAIWMYYRAGGTFHSCAQSSDVNDKQEEVVSSCKYLAIDSAATVDSYVVSNTIDQPKFAGEQNNDMCNYQAEHSDSYLVAMNSATWAGTVNYSDFLQNTTLGTTINDRAFPIVDMVQNLTEQYGGYTVEARSRNYYIDASKGIHAINTPTVLFGDVYNGVYYIPKSTSARKITDGHTASVFDYIKVGLESRVYPETMNKVLKNINGSFDGAIASNLKALEVKNLQEYDAVHSVVPSSILTQSRPFNIVDITEYNNRITVSTIKTAGETIDSWTKINLGTYLDLESQFGSITSFIRSKDNVFAFQPKGIAYISIYPDKQTQTGTGQIQLAKGDVLDNFQYISENSGTENKQCIAVFEDRIFYIDTINRTLNELKQGEVSTLKGFNSTVQKYMNDLVKYPLSNDNEYGGFVWINNRLKQVMFKFAHPEEFPVLAYNYELNYFTNSRTYASTYYMSYNNYVISNWANKLYRHNMGTIGTYYNSSVPSYIEMYLEPLPGVDKVFDSIVVLKEGDSNFDKIKITSPTRTSGDAFVDLIFKDKYDIHSAHLPRVENSLDRWRERNIKMILQYNGNTSFEVDEIFVKFSVKK